MVRVVRVILYGLHLNKCEKGQQKCYNIVVSSYTYSIQRESPCMHTNANTRYFIYLDKNVLKGYPKHGLINNLVYTVVYRAGIYNTHE